MRAGVLRWWVMGLAAVWAAAGAGAQSDGGGEPQPATGGVASSAAENSSVPLASLMAVLGSEGKVRETDHFAIAYNGEYDHLRPLIGRVEGVYAAVSRMCQHARLIDRPPPDRLSILFFDSFADYRTYAASLGESGDALAGFYHSGSNLAVFYNTLTRPDLKAFDEQIEALRRQMLGAPRDRSGGDQRAALQRQIAGYQIQRDAFVDRINRLVIQHETAHQVLFNLGVHVRGGMNPGWLVEGLACQFEVAQSGGHGGLGTVNDHRLADLREAFALERSVLSPTPQQRRVAFESGRFVPLAELIGDAEVMAQRGDANMNYRYAEAWSLVYYLNRFHREDFVGYLSDLRNRAPGETVGRQQEIQLFEKRFGAIDARLEDAWIGYMLSIPSRNSP